MIDVNNLSVSFSGTPLFSGISFKLTPGDKAGLIGKNGSGKSTLLNVIAGHQEYEGILATGKNTKIGFLQQDISFTNGKTILEETYLAFTEIKSIESKMQAIHQVLAQQSDYQTTAYNQLLHELDELTHRYELIGGYHYKGETERVLQGLGFKREEFDKLTETFSGGWRMRIELAKLLLQDNDVLLLDEPTNHLDLDAIIWFENFLKNYKGIVLLVSHDRMFLDHVTNRTIEISLGKIYDFKQNYSAYKKIRKELMEKQLQTKKNQEKQIKETEQLIEKFRYKASKAAFAQSLIKKLEKVERIEVDVEDNAVMHVQFPMAEASGKIVFTLENVSKKYGDKPVIDNYSLLIERGSRIAFVGQNGMGKTTLAKMLVNEIEFEGEIQTGHHVKIGYFAQNQSEYLNPEHTLMQEMESVANDTNRIKIRDLLGSFLFSGDAVHKKIKVLSGGERNRLALCKMLLNPFNVLIMDEPTNHLDIPSKNVLKKALQQFEGTLILISHDRDFLTGMVTKVYEFREHQIKEFLGDITDYLEERQFDNFRDVERISEEKIKNKKENTYEKEKKRKRIKNRIRKLENEIESLEENIKAFDLLIQNNDERIQKDGFFSSYQALKEQLETHMQEWSDLQEELDA